MGSLPGLSCSVGLGGPDEDVVEAGQSHQQVLAVGLATASHVTLPVILVDSYLNIRCCSFFCLISQRLPFYLTNRLLVK